MRERLHTAEHIIRTIVEERHRGRFVSVRLKEKRGRITLASPEDLSLQGKEIENQINTVIGKNLPVKRYSVPREKADVINLDLVPPSLQDITIYEIEGFNKLACKGPHVQNTREIGFCKILSIERREGSDEYSIYYTVE
ncbi:hypothetical protein [[Eubacterium] cellulosolvens]